MRNVIEDPLARISKKWKFEMLTSQLKIPLVWSDEAERAMIVLMKRSEAINEGSILHLID